MALFGFVEFDSYKARSWLCYIRAFIVMAEGNLCEWKSLEQDHDKVKAKCEVKCEECIDSGDKAEGFCHQCAEFMCKECMDSHKAMKLFASHEVITLEHLKKGQTRKIAVKEPPTKTCHIHD